MVTLLACMTLLATAYLIAQQSKEAPPPGPQPSIKVSVNSVLVPVVVRDARGFAVGNLKKEDFQLFDQGKPQDISGFSIQERGALQSNSQPSVPPNTSNSGVLPPAPLPPPQSAPQRFIIFLFDDLHLTFSDLAQVQQAATKMVSSSLTDSDLADVVSFSGTTSGLTRDHAKLQEAILKLKPRELYRHSTKQCPDIDYYLADLIVNKHNEEALAAAIQDTMSCGHMQPNMRNMAEGLVRSSSMQALSIGDQDVRVTLGFVKEIVSKMATLPGQRSLILVSPGFLTITPEAMTLKSQIIDIAAQSNVTVSALDARGLYVNEMDASQMGDQSTYSMMTGQSAQHQRDSAEINEDVMAELADGTGGTFIHNTNDLEGGMKKLATAPEYLYLLELSLQAVKPNGTYHSLKVKVNQPGLKIQARRGYFAPKPPTDTK